MTGETPPPGRHQRWLRMLVIFLVLIPLIYEISWLWRFGPIFSLEPIHPSSPPAEPAVPPPAVALPQQPLTGPEPEPESSPPPPAEEPAPEPEPEKIPPAMAGLQRMLAAASPGGEVKQRKKLPEATPAAPVSGMKSLDTFRDCEQCPLMVVLPTARFAMGSSEGNAWEKPRHMVGIKRRYALGRFEVTEQQWQACVDDQYCDRSAAGGGGRLPVVKVSWLDTRDYVEWLSAKTGRHYRLPTEAEWANGARGGTTTSRFWGEDRTNQCLYANGADQALAKTRKLAADFADCNDHFARRAPVGSFKGNSFGLRDTSGNVWEWVQDCWFDNYIGAPADGSARSYERCDEFVIRGGSWRMRPEALRSAARGHALMKQRSDDLGFRVAAD